MGSGGRRRRSRVWTGALTGLVVAAPLCAFLHYGHRTLGIPFAPYAIFEQVTGRLPGGLVTRGIDTLVAVLRRLGVEDTAAGAKWFETAVALLGYAALCAVLGSVLFAVLYRLRHEHARTVAVAMAALVLAAISLAPSAQQDSASLWNVVWTLVGTGLWATALRFVQWRLHAPNVGEDVAVVSRARRRQILVQLAGASAVVTLVGVGLAKRAQPRGAAGIGGAGLAGEPWSATHPLPNAGAAVKPVPGTRPELTPVGDHYRVDINIRPPQVDGATWRLRFTGLVRSERSFTLEQLRAYPATDQLITLSCISNPVGGDLIGTTRWTGVSFARLLEDVELAPEATHLKLVAADGFDEVVSLDEIRGDPRVMLAWAWDGLPLTAEHGFPLRVYLPNRYGMKQPKWIERIEAISAWQPGYWVRRGWDKDALVKATSVIDVIGPEAVRGADGRMLLPVGGIAYSGARGISRVEVRVDDGPWQPAQLREPLSDRTWVLWRYEWPFSEGEHRFEVRCFDGSGRAQLEERAPPHPSGASGLHSRRWS